MSNVISVRTGADLTMLFEWDDANGDPMPIANPIVFDASPQISSRFSVEEVDYATGKMNVFFEGTDPVRVGAYFFRVQVTDSEGDTMASPRVRINVI